MVYYNVLRVKDVLLDPSFIELLEMAVNFQLSYAVKYLMVPSKAE